MVGVRRRGEEWFTRYIGDLGLRQRLFEHEARGVKPVGKGQPGEEAAFGAGVVDRGGERRVKRLGNKTAPWAMRGTDRGDGILGRIEIEKKGRRHHVVRAALCVGRKFMASEPS